MGMPISVTGAATMVWRRGAAAAGQRLLPEETAVVLTYDRASFAVMMASPASLEDFAVGFSLSEGIVAGVSEIAALEIVALPDGVECRMSLSADRCAALAARRRYIAGPAGCGLCGIDSLAQALRTLPAVASDLRVSARQIEIMLEGMARGQTMNRDTRAVHAAGFWTADCPEMLVREDIGRHNALDKLIGAVARRGDAACSGAVCMTSRVSIELVQKAAVFGVPLLVAISVPTAHAVRAAEAAGITLVAVARDDGFEVFTHPARVDFAE